MNHHQAKGGSSGPLRVLFSCTGIGIFNRGIETFFRDSFDHLKTVDGLKVGLVKGRGEKAPREYRVWTLPRTGILANGLGRVVRRNSYVIEQWSSFFGVARQIRRTKPGVVYFSDANLGYLLYRFRSKVGVPYRLLFSNGGPCNPPFDRVECVHQVAPLYREHALSVGEPEQRQLFVPYGFSVPERPKADGARKAELRARLGLPPHRPVVLSVGWIAARHKRMDYVVREIARMSVPRPFLQLVGVIDQESAAIADLAARLLGVGNFSLREVKPSQVADYYRSADIFTLASLSEGFGRVYIEALAHGLPVIAHNHPVMKYVIGDVGTLADLNLPGMLERHIVSELSKADDPGLAVARWNSIRERFSWEVLAASYKRMFEHAATLQLIGKDPTRAKRP